MAYQHPHLGPICANGKYHADLASAEPCPLEQTSVYTSANLPRMKKFLPRAHVFIHCTRWVFWMICFHDLGSEDMLLPRTLSQHLLMTRCKIEKWNVFCEKLHRSLNVLMPSKPLCTMYSQHVVMQTKTPFEHLLIVLSKNGPR